MSKNDKNKAKCKEFESQIFTDPRENSSCYDCTDAQRHREKNNRKYKVLINLIKTLQKYAIGYIVLECKYCKVN